MDTIFTHSPTEEELDKILAENISEEQYIEKLKLVEYAPIDYLILCDLEQLFSIRKDTEN